MEKKKSSKILKSSFLTSVLLGMYTLVNKVSASDLGLSTDMVAYASPGGFGGWEDRTFLESAFHLVKELFVPIVILLFVAFFCIVGFITVVKWIVRKIRGSKKKNDDLVNFKQQ